MMDLKEKGSEQESTINTISGTQINKICSNCHTTTTPLWRVGPSGPKSLCNACGIKYNKKRRALLGLERERKEKVRKRRNKVGESLKVRWRTLGTEMVLQRSEKQRNKWGEEERAAIVLMALSCGSLYP